MNVKPTLERGLKELGIKINEQQFQSLLDYVELLNKWNKAYNLTAIRNIDEMLIHHVLDSLAVVPFYQEAKTVLDVGTGAGLPGIILAIIYPDIAFTLLDSNGKKTRFLQNVKRELALSNIMIINERVEGVQETAFDIITSRAFADLTLMVKLTAHLLAPQGKMVAMKGPKAQSELEALQQHGAFLVENLDIIPVNVPFLDAERNVVCFKLVSVKPA